jgi:NhaA family Na+:H+ antiporter
MIRVFKNVLRTTFIDPLLEFFHDSRAIGIVLLVCTFLSLIIANTVGQPYLDLWNIEIPFAHSLQLPHTILHVINDGMMAIFFFLAGMEIKRELIDGELSSFKQSILPVGAAIGGMIVPAIIFLTINAGTAYTRGWAIPTATDIAFSLGVASLLGNRVPVSIKIFLTALAIIDDLGAIIIIALFYGGSLHIYYLLAAIIICLLLFLKKQRSKSFDLLFIIGGIALWYCIYNSGIHAAIAGVVFAFIIPSKHLVSLEKKLHHPVYFVVMPLFALANTAIIFPADPISALASTLATGIIAALFIGKPLGIGLVSWLLIRFKIAQFPNNASWQHLTGAGILAGIGFTMSIFISTLAFDSNNQDISKIAVLIASFASIFCGYFWLNRKSKA